MDSKPKCNWILLLAIAKFFFNKSDLRLVHEENVILTIFINKILHIMLELFNSKASIC